MNKEHIFQVGISIDEDAIKAGLNEQVTNMVLHNIEKIYYDPSYGRRTPTRYLDELVEAKVLKIIEENKDVIIQNASEMLVDKLFRTKAVKEAIKKATGDSND